MKTRHYVLGHYAALQKLGAPPLYIPGMAIGATVGGIGGALAGGEDRRWTGGLIGGALGGAAGGAVGGVGQAVLDRLATPEDLAEVAEAMRPLLDKMHPPRPNEPANVRAMREYLAKHKKPRT